MDRSITFIGSAAIASILTGQIDVLKRRVTVVFMNPDTAQNGVGELANKYGLALLAGYVSNGISMV